MPEIILNVRAINVQKEWAKNRIEAAPVGDLLYLVEVPKEGVAANGDDKVIFNAFGIAHVVKELEVVLYLMDVREEDF